jgi:hypothetical protein
MVKRSSAQATFWLNYQAEVLQVTNINSFPAASYPSKLGKSRHPLATIISGLKLPGGQVHNYHYAACLRQCVQRQDGGAAAVTLLAAA